MKLIAYGKAKILGTNKTILLEEEFPVYNLLDMEWEKIVKAKNTALAYIEEIIDRNKASCRYRDGVLVFDPSEYHIMQLMNFMERNFNKGLKLKLRKEK
jgi:hypothetical protein